MKKLFIVIVILVSISTVFLVVNIIKTSKAPEIKEAVEKPVYDPAPDFALMDIFGKEQRLSDFRGKVIILSFWATWCPPCRKGIPNFIELYNEYKDDGLEIIGITLDWNAARQAPPFAIENGINYTILIGKQEVSDLYGGVVSIPTTFIIDRDGGLKKRYIGYQEKDIFEREIKELL
ncbi:MAG: TlpA family protein disulfide reductase [Candidatus Omnitrophica bacterium]|nr:TlpA family protein disulfide reductase [Candidatus Omnitrophota bacterium]MBU4149489.1 TlpA family protein disulfide reductase [Candidatus Omnitrophota bacterium]